MKAFIVSSPGFNFLVASAVAAFTMPTITAVNMQPTAPRCAPSILSMWPGHAERSAGMLTNSIEWLCVAVIP